MRFFAGLISYEAFEFEAFSNWIIGIGDRKLNASNSGDNDIVN